MKIVLIAGMMMLAVACSGPEGGGGRVRQGPPARWGQRVRQGLTAPRVSRG